MDFRRARLYRSGVRFESFQSGEHGPCRRLYSRLSLLPAAGGGSMAGMVRQKDAVRTSSARLAWRSASPGGDNGLMPEAETTTPVDRVPAARPCFSEADIGEILAATERILKS